MYEVDGSSAMLMMAVGTFISTYMVVVIGIAVLQIIAMWKVFEKAGQKGWKAIIPIYNMVILFKIAGLSPWLLLVYLAGIIPFVGWIAALVLNVVTCTKLSNAYGKGGGFAVGLFFLPTIFYMILGFGKAEYQGVLNE